MDSPQIFTRFSELLQAQYGIDPDQVALATPLEALGIDSMHSVDVLFSLEEELGIQFKDLAMPRNATVGDVVDLIGRNLAAAG